MADNESSIKTLSGVGDKTASLFAKLGVYTLEDIAEYYPRDYKEYPDTVSVDSLRPGQTAAVKGMITDSLTVTGRPGKKIITCHVSDGTGVLSLTYFNALFLKNILRKGGHYVFYGKVREFKGRLSMEHPEFFPVEEYAGRKGRMLPVYAKTKGLSDKTISKAVDQALSKTAGRHEYLLPEMLESFKLMDMDMAMRQVHFPDNREKAARARKRIAFDELFFFLLEIRASKALINEEGNSHPVNDTKAGKAFVKKLPFDLTKGQQCTIKEIEKDMASDHVMRRIIQGDVGSGKTIVALTAMINAVECGYQAAMMAPTEVLARQHFETIREYFDKYEIHIRVECLTGSAKAKDRARIYEELENGEIGILVGTHAIIQERVEFKDLGLVITDEQHRFGVKQRDFLAGKGRLPHVLVMSATPIPRTLGLIIYGDMDISLIKELPAERLPIKNCVVGPESRDTSYGFIKKEIEKGHQAYVICPMVEESEDLEVCDVVTYTDTLRKRLPGIRIEYLHGRMKPQEKNDIMEAFAAGEIGIIVSTTVIEVGINVPNATVIMIENAERFGLATLHQLRGRVGRGPDQSYCIMINTSESEEARERLDVLNRSNDGFYIASEDLKTRGMGDMLGIRQSGEMNFKMADIFEDADILKIASRLSEDISGRLTADEAEKDPFIKDIYLRFKEKSEKTYIDAL
ncbi:MAG: ATP-dependent DNA helicase RecG [Lachnospiraceae bacterium]|nr:ATP-dependent DNA helicase RecG [Lachnospiraceae bacterium]